MSEQNDKDDVDVYVSPRRFVGCTPGPKATRKKIMEQKLKEENENQRERINFGLEDVTYGQEFRDSKADVHKNVAKNNTISLTVLVLSYIVIILGVALVSVSIWVALGDRNGGIASYSSRRGFFIGSPLALGICLLIGGSLVILLGFFYGVKHLVPSIVEGLHDSQNRTSIIHYQVGLTIGVLLFGAVMFSAVSPLHDVRSHGITSTLWREMSVQHPEKICNYEVANGCGGSRNGMCLLPGARRNFACPGHYCEYTCSATSMTPNARDASCKNCMDSFSSRNDISRCRQSESERGTSGTCLSKLASEVTRYFTIVIAATSIGLGSILCMIVMGTIGSVISMSG